MLVNSGQSYERKHLLRELEARAGVDPCTQARFEDRPLIAENRTLERAIAHWREHRVKDSGGHGVAKVPTDESGEPVRRQCSTCNKFKTQFQMRGADSASVSELFRTSRSRRWRLHETMSPRRRRRGRQRDLRVACMYRGSFGTLSCHAGHGTMLKTCDSCRLRARGYYTSRRKRKQGEVDKREAGGDALVAMAATAPPAYARTPGPTPP